MSADGEYSADPEAMRAAAGNLSGILVQAIGTVLDLEALALPADAFGALGGDVAAGATQVRTDQVRALRALLDLLRDTGDAVRRSGDGYADADRDTAASYAAVSGGSVAAQPFWSSQPPDRLAWLAVADGTGAGGTPYSVRTVLDYLSRTGLGDPGHRPAARDVAGFADWLDASTDHQARLGLIQVYSGEAAGLTDVPGMRRGDVVVGQPAAEPAVIGIAGGDGELYNHGPVGADLTDGWLRVYRPLPNQQQ